MFWLYSRRLYSRIAAFTRTLATVATPSPKGAVVSNGEKCAEIGASILNKGGSAVDAAIAALLAEGTVVPNSMGIGGGFIMTVYIKEKGIVEILDAREVAPGRATEDMYGGDSNLATQGALAVAVPGELRGFGEAYKKYGGKVPWKDLIQPTIDLCRNGVLMTDMVHNVCLTEMDLLKGDEVLSETFLDPKSHKPYVLNECIRYPKLAKTLELIADCGVDVLYDGPLTGPFVKGIQDKGGIITAEDLKTYTPEWRTPITICMPSDHTLYTSPLPTSGVILTFIINILSDFLDLSQPCCVTNFHRVVESFKFGFGRRTDLGDPHFKDYSHLIADLTSLSYAEGIREKIYDDRTCQDPAYYGANIVKLDRGTANICVLAPNGDAVSATSSINHNFGAGYMCKSTGIILNNLMDDFSSPNIISKFDMPPSLNNYIKPGKRPLSSKCPTIILGKDGNVRMIVGAAGGPRILTSVALTIIKHLWFNYGIQDAVSEKRFHHQLFPMLLEFEDSFNSDMDLVKALHKIGHEYRLTKSVGFNAVTAISQLNGIVDAALDPRRGGEKIFVF